MDYNSPSEGIASNLGMSSLVIGLISLFLFFLPILGIPLGVIALGLGVIGSLVALGTGGLSLRWGLGGMAVSALALGVNLAIVWF